MRSLFAFIKKELTEQIRSGRLMIIVILFSLFGIMNPAIAKLTPWLLDMFADSLAETGMSITAVSITALDSWMQFFKNAPMALIAFVLLQSSIFTKEYSSGTLVLSLTKGLKRSKVVISKSVVLAVIWTLGYALCFGITYVYNAYFWDNSIAHNLIFSVVCWWVFGMWVIGLVILFSTLSSSSTGVLCGTGGFVLLSYIIELIPKLSKYMPTFLTDGNSLTYGLAESGAYVPSLIITAFSAAAFFVISIPLFNKKQL